MNTAFQGMLRIIKSLVFSFGYVILGRQGKPRKIGSIYGDFLSIS
jgi:hypothetical protein